MFRRLELEPWMLELPNVALWIFITVFLIAVVRVLMMPKPQQRYLESLPLDREEPRYEE